MAWKEVLITNQGSGTAVTAAVKTSLLPVQAKKNLDPNFFDKIGKRLHIHAGGKVSTVITTPGTPSFQVQLGATVVFDTLAMLCDVNAAHTNVPWSLDLYMNATVVGVSVAALLGYGEFKSEIVRGSGTMPLGSLVAMLPWNTAPVAGNTFDSTVSQLLDLMWTQTAATGSITLQDYEVTTNHTERD